MLCDAETEKEKGRDINERTGQESTTDTFFDERVFLLFAKNSLFFAFSFFCVQDKDTAGSHNNSVLCALQLLSLSLHENEMNGVLYSVLNIDE